MAISRLLRVPPRQFDHQTHMGGSTGKVRHAAWQTASCAVDHRLPPIRKHCTPIEAPLPCPSDAPSRKISDAPGAWVYCKKALRLEDGTFRAGKTSPGIVALIPGATLAVSLGAILGSKASDTGRSRASVSLSYLVSFEHMGIIACECEGACECTAHRIDAHRSLERSASTFESHEISISARSNATGGACMLRFTVLRETSSGGHKFKLREIDVSVPTSR